MTTAAILATPAAILAVVNFAKRLGLPVKGALVLALVLGIAFSIGDQVCGANVIYASGANGLLLGLGAAGLYDVAKTIAQTVTPADGGALAEGAEPADLADGEI